MPILTIVTLLIQFLPAILQGLGAITPVLATLIEKLGAAIPGLISALAAGKGVTPDILDVLTAMQSELAVLQSNTDLDAGTLSLARSLGGALEAALANYTAAATVCDPSTLTPLPTLP